MTTTLRIEHTVTDFDTWKGMFDSDPLGREKSGVRRYRVYRAADNPSNVAIELDFDSVKEAEALLAGLKQVWAGPAANVISNPQARINELVESHEY